MKTKFLINLTVLTVLSTPNISLAEVSKATRHTETESKYSSSNFMKGAYISFGMGNSMPQSKTSTALVTENNFYTPKRLKDSQVYKASIGKSYNNFRSEFEYLYTKRHNLKLSKPYDNGLGSTDMSHKYHTSHNTYFFNIFHDFKGLSSFVKPYVGVGAGLSRNKVSPMTTTINFVGSNDVYKFPSKTSNSFAWNASVGLLAEVNKNIYFDLSYKFLDLGKIKGATKFTAPNGAVLTSSQNVKGHIRNHLVLLGIGFKL